MNSYTQDIKKEIEARLPDVKLRWIRDSLIIENPENLTRIVLFLKENPTFRLDYLSSITGADYLGYLESVYHLYSMTKKQGPLVLRVRVPRTSPRIPSLMRVFRGADLQEREIYDLFGILYQGHENMSRLMMWEGFEGHPLRKDYEPEDTETLEVADIEWLEKRGIGITNEVKEKAKNLKADGKRAIALKPEKPRPV